MATNVTGRRRDDRALLLWPDGMAERLAQRRVRPITGTWRAGGTGNPGESYVLFVIEQGGKVVATDMDRHGQMVGRVTREQNGRATVQGTFARSDGTRGSFQWVVAPHGSTFAGVWRANGRQGAWDGVKQGDGIPKQLLAYLVNRQSELRSAGLARDPGLGAGVAGIEMCDAKVGGVKIGRVPCGFTAKGPGGSEIKVNRKGIDATPPSLEKIIEETAGTGGDQGATSPATGGETPAERSSKFLKIALGVAVVGTVIGLFAYARTRQGAPADVQV